MSGFDPDPEKLAAIVDRMRRHQAQSEGPIAFTLEEFFDGNNDPGSLLCNVADHPGMSALHAALATLRGQKDVRDVRVIARELEAEDTWPFSDSVAVVTTATRGEIEQRVRALLPEAAVPDDVADDADWGDPPASGLPPLAPGERVVRLWWD